MIRRVWWPAAPFVAVPVLEALLSFRTDAFVDAAAVVHRATLDGLHWACWLLAVGLLAVPTLRSIVVGALDAPSQEPSPVRHRGAVAAALGSAALLCFLKYCQYRGSQFDQDTAVVVQRAFNTLHGHWFHTGVYGVNYLSIHFAFVVDLFAPLLLVWRSALPFLFLQAFALASMGLAVYFLVHRATKSVYAGFLGMLLVYSSPAYAQMGSAALNDGAFVAPCLLWGLVFWEHGRRPWSLAFFALAAASREHFPVSLGALGLYAAFREGRPTAKTLREGASLIAAAVALLFVELKIIGSFANRINADWFTEFQLYKDFTGGHGAFLGYLATHPAKTLASMFRPFDRVRPALELVFYAGLFPLAAPAAFGAFAVALIPQLLAVGGFHDMIMHYPSLAYGLLMFAAAQGLSSCHAFLKARGREQYLLLPVLLIAGLGFRNSAIPLTPGFAAASFADAPAVEKLVPPDASLWIEEYFAAWSPARAQLKIIAAGNASGFDAENFSRELFKPDFVVLQAVRLIEGNRDLRPVLLFLADNAYQKHAQAKTLLIVRAPDRALPGAPSPFAALPVLTAEQHAAFDYFPVWLGHKIRGTADPNPPKLTAEQKRIVDYLAYLLKTG